MVFPSITYNHSSSPQWRYMVRSAHLTLLHLVILIIPGEENRSRSSSLCSCPSLHPLRSKLLQYSISNTLNLSSSFNVRDHVYDLRFSRRWLWRMVSFGMLRRVALVRTDVSEELSASFIRVTRIGELGTRPAITSNRRTLRRNTQLVLFLVHLFLSPWWRRR
jgi:hypothetical protein